MTKGPEIMTDVTVNRSEKFTDDCYIECRVNKYPKLVF